MLSFGWQVAIITYFKKNQTAFFKFLSRLITRVGSFLSVEAQYINTGYGVFVFDVLVESNFLHCQPDIFIFKNI